MFQTHDYRHSVATALYEHGASIQAIREFLEHKHENMTRRYIDCIQRHVDRSSEQYYKEQKSLVSEWKEGSGSIRIINFVHNQPKLITKFAK